MKNDDVFIANEWQRRAAAEYYSAGKTTNFLHHLMLLGIDEEFLFDCNKIVRDEISHTSLSRSVLEKIPINTEIEIQRQDLYSLDHSHKNHIWSLVDFTIQFFCCGETIGQFLFQRMLEGANIPVVKKVLKVISKDESSHSNFGWKLISYLIEVYEIDDKNKLWSTLNRHLATMKQSYAMSKKKNISSYCRGWGLIDPEEYRTISLNTINDLIIPRFQKLF